MKHVGLSEPGVEIVGWSEPGVEKCGNYVKSVEIVGLSEQLWKSVEIVLKKCRNCGIE